MSEAAGAVIDRPDAQSDVKPDAPADATNNRVAELKVSGHLMTLDAGLFCVLQAPGSPAPDTDPGCPECACHCRRDCAGRPDAVSISTFRQDGWMDGRYRRAGPGGRKGRRRSW